MPELSHSEVRRVFGNRVDTRYLRALTAARRTDKQELETVRVCPCLVRTTEYYVVA